MLSDVSDVLARRQMQRNFICLPVCFFFWSCSPSDFANAHTADQSHETVVCQSEKQTPWLRLADQVSEALSLYYSLLTTYLV